MIDELNSQMRQLELLYAGHADKTEFQAKARSLNNNGFSYLDQMIVIQEKIDEIKEHLNGCG